MRFVLNFGMGDPMHGVPLAKAAEAAGFDSMGCPDSFFYPKVSDSKYFNNEDGDRTFLQGVPFFDPAVWLATWAAHTTKLRFYPSVYKLPSRHPVQVAKIFSSLCVASDNRISLGVGSSPWREDLTVFGLEFETRGKRMDECIAIIRGLLTGQDFSFDGQFYKFPEVKMTPAPSKPMPILVGGHAPPALRRAAKFGDGWVSANTTFDVIKGMIEKLNEARREAGTDKKSYEIHAFDVGLTKTDDVKRLADLGVTDAVVIPWLAHGFNPTLEQKLDAVKRFSGDVIAKLR
jgi:probable F420-dependent oxidoreductase